MRLILRNAGCDARMHDERLPTIFMRGEMVGGEKAARSAERLQQQIPEYRSTFGKDAISWTPIAEDTSRMYRVVEGCEKEKCIADWTSVRHANERFTAFPLEFSLRLSKVAEM